MVAHEAWDLLADAAPLLPEKVQLSARLLTLLTVGDAVMSGWAGEAATPVARVTRVRGPRSLNILNRQELKNEVKRKMKNENEMSDMSL
jgi:hypothetical protein